MGIKVKQRDIKNCIVAEDITNTDPSIVYSLQEYEKGFERVAYSSGIYGINGLIIRGRTTGRYFKICCRSTALFIVL